MNELQMLDFIKDVLWKAAVESHKETSYSELGKSNLKKKQDDISRAITLLELNKLEIQVTYGLRESYEIPQAIRNIRELIEDCIKNNETNQNKET